MKFDDPKVGNSLKDRKLHGELKECEPITARAKKFLLKKRKSTVIAERKQFPLIFGHTITAHKSQGSTLPYMQGDLNRFTGKKRRIINNPYFMVNFTPYFPVPTVVMRFYCVILNRKILRQMNLLYMRSWNKERVILFLAIPLNRIELYWYVSIQCKVMEWSSRTFSQWRDILKLFQPILFHRN